MSELLHKINPFYKFLVVTLLATALTFIHLFEVNVLVFGVSLLFIVIGTKPRTWLKAIKILLAISILAFSIFMSGFLWGNSNSDLGTLTLESTSIGLNLFSRFYSFAGLGMLLALTTDPYAFIQSLQKDAKLPRKFAYGIMAAIHLVPHMKAEYKNARLAFQVRGANAHPLAPKVIFSMLVNCFRWSEALSIAMMSKGFYEK